MNRQRVMAYVLVILLVAASYYQVRNVALPPLTKKSAELKRQKADLLSKKGGLMSKMPNLDAPKPPDGTPTPAQNQAQYWGSNGQWDFLKLASQAAQVSGATWQTNARTQPKGMGGQMYEVKYPISLTGNVRQAQAFISYLEAGANVLRVSNVSLTDKGGTMDVTLYLQSAAPLAGATPPPATPAAPAKP